VCLSRPLLKIRLRFAGPVRGDRNRGACWRSVGRAAGSGAGNAWTSSAALPRDRGMSHIPFRPSICQAPDRLRFRAESGVSSRKRGSPPWPSRIRLDLLFPDLDPRVRNCAIVSLPVVWQAPRSSGSASTHQRREFVVLIIARLSSGSGPCRRVIAVRQGKRALTRNASRRSRRLVSSFTAMISSICPGVRSAPALFPGRS